MIGINQQSLETLHKQFKIITSAQKEIEAILEQALIRKKALPKRSAEYQEAETLCESLEYAVDDLDSVLANLDEIITTEP